MDWNSATTKKHIKEAKAVGLTLVGDGRNRHYRTYSFNHCGHSTERLVGYVRKIRHTPKCWKCIQNNYKEEAYSVGLEFIRRTRGSNYAKYRFINCKHLQKISIDSVRKNSFRCQKCLIRELEKEAYSSGLKLIQKGRSDKKNQYWWYRFDKCKHKQEIQSHRVRMRTFICNTCEETALDLPSKVYLLKLKLNEFYWLKLGHAQYVKRRIKEYGLPDDAEVEILKTINFDTGREARAFENKLHKQYKIAKIGKRKMKKLMQFGFDECYKPEAQYAILNNLKTRKI